MEAKIHPNQPKITEIPKINSTATTTKNELSVGGKYLTYTNGRNLTHFHTLFITKRTNLY